MSRRYFNFLNAIAVSAFITAAILVALGVHHWRLANHYHRTGSRLEQLEEDQSAEMFFYAAICVAVMLACRIVYKVRRAKQSAKRREALRRQICLACGYDLRGTPERCPECGAVYTRYL